MAVSKSTKSNNVMASRHSKRSLRSSARKSKRKAQGLAVWRELCPTGKARPKSALDQKAESLGIYSEEYHCMNRLERKHLVSAAYKQSKAA